MAYDRYLIAPFNSGLQTNLKPWLIPDDAFPSCRNAYVWRGRVRKRPGSILMGTGTGVTAQQDSRLRIQVGTTTTQALSGTAGTTIFGIGQMFSVAGIMLTSSVLGTPATLLVANGSATTATYNTSNGAFVFAGLKDSLGVNIPDATPVYFYPATPVMGLTVYEKGMINNQPAIAFDMQYAYQFSTAWNIMPTSPTWKGTNSDFFWSYNWQGVLGATYLFTSNFNFTVGSPGASDDPMYYWNGSAWANFSALTTFATVPNTFSVATALIIVPFKDRLLLLNVVEQDASGPTNTQYVNRCRYSAPFFDPTTANAWTQIRQTGYSGAGFLDATTSEAIVSAEFIKDRLIVYFEESTWELVDTGNQIKPFKFQKLNTELGSEATFSTVPFDKAVLTIGNTGVHSCNGSNVERIDVPIPDFVFEIQNKNEGVTRVAGIRDYYSEMVYWTFPETGESSNTIFPNQILAYNYRNEAWALFDDSITAFGYFEQQSDLTWATIKGTWASANYAWNSGVTEANFRQVIAGNQQGWVFIILPDESRNAPVLQISAMSNFAPGNSVTLTIVNHNLTQGSFIAVENAQGVDGINNGIYQVFGTPTANTISIGPIQFTGTYTGGGQATTVSNIQILTKQFNPYVEQGRNVFIAKVDCYVDKTSAGEITVDYYPSSTELSMLDQAEGTGCLLGNGVLQTSPYEFVQIEQFQARLWHTLYLQAEGDGMQLYFNFTVDQITDPLIAWSDFQLHGMLLHTMATRARLT